MLWTQIRREAAPAEEKNAQPVQAPGHAAMPAPPPGGHRPDLPDRMRERMESSFGADFTETRGGSGLPDGPQLEAGGGSAYQGPVTPIGRSSAVSASGPIQAKKHEEKADIQMERTGMEGNAKDLGYFDRRRLAKAYDAEEKRRRSLHMPVTGETAGNVPAAPKIEDAKTPRERQVAQTYAVRMASGQAHAAKTGLMVHAANDPTKDHTPEDFNNWFNEEFEQGGRDRVKYRSDIELKTGEGNALGITLDRSGKELYRLAAEQGMSDEEIRQMLVDAALKSRRDAADPNSDNEEERARAASENERTNAALKKIKNVYYGGIKSARDKYGVMLTQLHPEDALNQAGDLWKDTHWTQDTMNMLSLAPELFDPESQEDQEFASLTQYFMATQMMLQMYGDYADGQALEQSAGIPNMSRDAFRRSFNNAKRNEANVLAGDRSGILKMGDKEKRAYRRKAKQKHGNMGLANLFDNEDESVDLAGLQEADHMPVNENEHIDTISDLYRKRYGNT